MFPYATCADWSVCRTRGVTLWDDVMRRITTFRSTTDRIYDGGPIILYYI